MHPCFIDITTAYTADAPFTGALGGTQAAVCHVSAELVKAGVPVTLINQHREARAVFGVQNLPPEALDDKATLQNFSHLIFNGRWTEKLVRKLKQRTTAPLLAWMHEACFENPYIPLCPDFSGFVFVSEWQKKVNGDRLSAGLRHAIIPNGIAPAFQQLQNAAQKSDPPIALYAGSSKRGLFFLPQIIPLLHQAHPELRFEIYNDGVIGTDETRNAAFRETLAALPGVTHLGAVDQNLLAERMRRATFLLSPNTYPETFCIVMAEALSAGVYCLSTTRATLPDTAGGFAALMPVDDTDNTQWLPEGLNPAAFARFASQHISAWQKKTAEEKQQHLTQQIAFARSRYSWAQHAQTWVGFLKGF